MISTCQGIQRLYFARKAGEQQHLNNREAVAQKARDLRAQLAAETDPETIRFLKRERNATVNLLSEIDRKIEIARVQQQELANDFQFQKCDILIGQLE